MHTAQLSAFLTNVGDLQDGPVRADDRADSGWTALRPQQCDATGPDRKTPALWAAIIDANQIERDGLVGELAKTHPELTAIAFATISECVSFSAGPDVIMIRVRQGTSNQIALEYIAELRSAFPGVPVMAITAD